VETRMLRYGTSLNWSVILTLRAKGLKGLS
jgi:hypothetical protein